MDTESASDLHVPMLLPLYCDSSTTPLLKESLCSEEPDPFDQQSEPVFLHKSSLLSIQPVNLLTHVKDLLYTFKALKHEIHHVFWPMQVATSTDTLPPQFFPQSHKVPYSGDLTSLSFRIATPLSRVISL